jgi:formylglycine-generating enzyme required for sulfatase activity
METAADGPANQGSPFTAALLGNLATPGLDIKDLFFRVGSEVVAKTKGVQRPEIAVSFYDAYALVPAKPAPAATTQPSPHDLAAQAWAATKDTNSQSILEEFIRQFGATPYGAMARARLDELKKNQLAAAAPPVVPVAPSDPCKEKVVTLALSGRSNCPLSGAEEAALKPKDSFRECDKCPEMLVVPAGSFVMGSPRNEDGHTKDEEPQHPVTFARQFAAGRFAVTFEEWDACVADGGCKDYTPWDNGWGRGRRPVINVSWQDAKSYVAWLSAKTGKAYRLLSEAEREYLTRAGTTAAFWWGNAIAQRQARYTVAAAGNKKSPQETTLVDAYDPNPWGFHQVHGNVWEWSEDCANPGYKDAPSDGTAWTAGTCTQRVLRGGSWISAAALLRSASRYGVGADGRLGNVGFRVARSIGP